MSDFSDIKRRFERLEEDLPDPQAVESHLEGLAQSVPDILYRLDGEGRIVYISEGISPYGLDPKQLIGTDFFELIHPADLQRARHRVNERRTGERSTRSFEVRLRLPNDEAVSFEVNEATETSPRLLIDAEGVYNSDRPVADAFLYTQGVARDVSHRVVSDGDAESRNVEIARRLGLQAQQMRRVYFQLREQIEHRERAENEAVALQKIRDQIWNMSSADELASVLATVRTGLEDLGLRFHGISIHHVDRATQHVNTYRHAPESSDWDVSEDADIRDRILQFVARGEAVYRPDLSSDDPFGEREVIERRWNRSIRSVLDVPTMAGTLAINSPSIDAFSERDRDLLERVANVVVEGLRRLRDLRDLEERSQQAEMLATERQAELQREAVLRGIRDRILTMRSLHDAPQEGEWADALRALGVPADGVSLQFPAAQPGHFVTFDVARAEYSDTVPLDLHPWVRRVWETGESIVVPQQELREADFVLGGNWRIVEVPMPGGGSLGVNRLDGEDFTDDMVRTVEAFASIIATGVRRLRDFEQMEQSEARYRHLVETLPLGVLHATLDGRVLYENAMAREIYGYTAEEFAGINIRNLYANPADRERMIAAMERDGRADFEYPMIHHDGREIWMQGHAVFARESGATEIHGFFEDVTERRRIEQERAQLEEQLRQAQKMEAVGQLTAGIAHNFNNMLQGISGNLQLAILDAEGEMQQMLSEADRVTHRAADMIRQMMVFARQGLHPAVRQIAVGPIVDNTVEICRRTFDRKIALEVSVAEDLQLYCDPGLLQQVILNMLINARDALLDGDMGEPRIDLTAAVVNVSAADVPQHAEATPGPYLCLSVRDNGIGMNQETQQRIFEPFFTTKPVDRGTGLGLSTVYGIVTQFSGWVRCDSEPGVGTAFEVFLPIGSEPPENQSPAVGLRTILVIDDEDVVRDTTRRLLQRKGYRVLVADSGPSGIGIVRAADPVVDLVLLDLSMPDMSGQDVLLELRRIESELKVVIFTGYATDEQQVDGADGMLQKPIAVDELLTRIEEALAT